MKQRADDKRTKDVQFQASPLTSVRKISPMKFHLVVHIACSSSEHGECPVVMEMKIFIFYIFTEHLQPASFMLAEN